ncbi:MAG: hypothetical protein ACRD8K_05745 [Nitrososphaeraceae archaeon]
MVLFLTEMYIGEFINSKENIHSYGYYETDELGNCEDFIIADEVEPDTCTLRFFDDKIKFLQDLMDQKFY